MEVLTGGVLQVWLSCAGGMAGQCVSSPSRSGKLSFAYTWADKDADSHYKEGSYDNSSFHHIIHTMGHKYPLLPIIRSPPIVTTGDSGPKSGQRLKAVGSCSCGYAGVGLPRSWVYS